MSSRKLPTPLKLVTGLFGPDGSANWLLITGVIGFSFVLIGAVLIAVAIDNTWYLPDNGRGLLRHYGAWAILLSDPLLVISVGYAFYKFRVTFSTLPAAGDQSRRKRLTLLVQKYVSWIGGHGYSAFGYVACVIFGFLCWANNVYQTQNPTPTFKHDVFDSTQHMAGFLIYKLCLFVSWVIVYPIVGYVMVTMTLAIWIVLQICRRNHLLNLHVTHPDNCYGLRSFGTLGIYVMFPYLTAYFVMFSLLITHGSLYGSITIPLAGMTALIASATYIILVPGYALFKQAKRQTYADLLSRSEEGSTRPDSETLHFTVQRLCYAATDSSPFSIKTKFILVVVNLIPLSGLSLTSLGQYFALIWR
jgi:hypothetical protein